MHRRYLTYTVSRCAELPPTLNSSKRKYPSPVSRRPSLEFKPKARNLKKGNEPKRHDSLKFDVILQSSKRCRLTSFREETCEGEKNIQGIMQRRHLTSCGFSKTVIEGAAKAKSMGGRAEAGAWYSRMCPFHPQQHK